MSTHEHYTPTHLSDEGELPLTSEEYGNILDIQQSVFEMLVTNRSDREILARLCRMAENLLPNSVASVMLKDMETGLMNVVSAPSIPEAGHQALHGLKPGPGGGSCGNAVFRNEPQYVTDTKCDNRWSDLRHIAYDFNLCSCWSMPIRDEAKKAVGSFALSSFEHRSPSRFHKRLLENCSFIVTMVLKRKEYVAQIEHHHRQLNILGTAIKKASDGMIITDKNNMIIEINDAVARTFGYLPEEIIGRDPSMLASGRHDREFYQKMWKSLQQNGHWSGEIWNKRSSGEVFPEWMSISAVPGEDGEIENYLAVFTDLTELHENQDKLVKMAYYDQLTGLPNRQKIVMDMEKNIPQACAVFNIDDFKEINDFFGILAGDDVLRQVAKWFLEMKLSAYRISGDEFAVLFYGEMSADSLRHRVMTLISMIEEKIFAIEDETIQIRTTVGAALGAERLITRADIALNMAKEQKNSFALYEEVYNIEETYRKNIAMASQIRQAIANQRIICYYQPILNITTGAVEKYETLVRMIGPDGEMVSPAEFLPIAKKTKIYPQITREVIYQACTVFQNREESFSINLSDSDIRDSGTVQSIIDTITRTGTASRIVFEILESEGIENFKEVTAFISRVKALGAKIAIDDFGTGYSNFENILKLGVDYIKIDGSLIRGIYEQQRHSLIVSTIVEFAHKIGAKTVAEFVSDVETFDAVLSHGIDYSQGYYTGKPGPL